MGTRAAFWVGDPQELENREWLGAVAWDGYEFDREMQEVKSEKEFRDAVAEIAEKRDDFSRPESGWPFPWADNIFLTDITYAYFDGRVQMCWFNYGWAASLEEADKNNEEKPTDVPAPSGYNPNQPDSIIIVQPNLDNRG